MGQLNNAKIWIRRSLSFIEHLVSDALSLLHQLHRRAYRCVFKLRINSWLIPFVIRVSHNWLFLGYLHAFVSRIYSLPVNFGRLHVYGPWCFLLFVNMRVLIFEFLLLLEHQLFGIHGLLFLLLLLFLHFWCVEFGGIEELFHSVPLFVFRLEVPLVLELGHDLDWWRDTLASWLSF